tara:strand:+ start:14790 stop:15287 length:498 start_codon:yes stop_codon:yes gene_type:complete
MATIKFSDCDAMFSDEIAFRKPKFKEGDLIKGNPSYDQCNNCDGEAEYTKAPFICEPEDTFETGDEVEVIGNITYAGSHTNDGESVQLTGMNGVIKWVVVNHQPPHSFINYDVDINGRIFPVNEEDLKLINRPHKPPSRFLEPIDYEYNSKQSEVDLRNIFRCME